MAILWYMKLASTLLSLPLLSLPLLLANGCADMTDTSPTPSDPCGAASLEHLVGQPFPDANELEALDLPGPVRVIAPGQAVTMDYIDSRLNIETDDDGNVVRLRCG